MASIKDIVIYFCLNYPHKGELSKARLTKMVYLADWVSAFETNKTLTNIKWVFNHYGPYVDEVWSTVRSEKSIFKNAYEVNFYGANKEVVALVDGAPPPHLSPEEKSILDRVIESTKEKYWAEFIKCVYSTYPIRANKRYANLDLVKLAKDYRSNSITKNLFAQFQHHGIP